MFQYREAFDPDDPTWVDHYPTYQMDTDLGDRPHPTQQCQDKILERKVRRKLKEQ